MKLLNELQERRKALIAHLSLIQARVSDIEAEIDELRVAIWALEGTTEAEGGAMQAEAGLEPPPAAVMSDDTRERIADWKNKYSGFQAEQETAPAAVTEPEPTEPEPQDDASEFSEEGYAPVVEAEPLADPIWNEPEPTKPEADALAKAADYYSPEAVAERNKFNPFAMFRKEGDQ